MVRIGQLIKRNFVKILTVSVLAVVITVIVCYTVQPDQTVNSKSSFLNQHLRTLHHPQRARLVFAGDLMQHLPQVRAACRPDGTFNYSETFRYVKPIFEEADFAMLNLETTLTPTSHYTGYPMFRSPAQLANAIRDIGIDAVMMSNNHICDNGRTGIEYMTTRFDSLGILHTGAFVDSSRFRANHPLRFQVNGIRFALFNYTYDTNGLPIPKGTIVNLIDTTAIKNDLDGIDRTQTDCVIIFFHWGDEYIRQPNKNQRRLAELCHRHGSEIVIGSHPHVIQPIKVRHDTDSVIRSITVYSLGNLVSNQRDRYKNGGLIITLDIEKKKEKIKISPYYTPVFVVLPLYRILPPAVADTLSMNATQEASYRQFINDTRRHLGHNRIIKEM